MNKSQKKMLDDMQVLAEFANLKDADVQRFRQSDIVSAFFPAGLWEGYTANGAPPLWKIEQTRVQTAWRTQFPPEQSVLMISEIAKLSKLEQFLDKVPQMSNERFAELSKTRDWIPQPECFPFQMAVMNLILQPWRAAICEICGVYFVKPLPRNRYCSSKCSTEAILRTKRISWAQHGQHWREKRQTKRLTRSKK